MFAIHSGSLSKTPLYQETTRGKVVREETREGGRKAKGMSSHSWLCMERRGGYHWSGAQMETPLFITEFQRTVAWGLASKYQRCHLGHQGEKNSLWKEIHSRILIRAQLARDPC